MGSSGDIVLDAPRVLVGEAEALLAVPAGVEVDASGNAYVVDRQDRQVRVFTRGGEPIRTIGGPGEGPGEFARPQFLGVSDGVVRILDTRRGTVQAFSASGTHIESYSTSAAGTVGHAADFDRDGTLVFSSRETPRRGGLVEIVDPEGGPSNHVLPIVDPGSDLWLFLQTEGILRRYRLNGTLLHAVELDEPEMEAIRDEYFEWYEAFDLPILSSMPPSDPSTPRTPSVTRRFFALDDNAGTLYVADTDTSSLYALDLPDGVRR